MKLSLETAINSFKNDMNGKIVFPEMVNGRPLRVAYSQLVMDAMIESMLDEMTDKGLINTVGDPDPNKQTLLFALVFSPFMGKEFNLSKVVSGNLRESAKEGDASAFCHTVMSSIIPWAVECGSLVVDINGRSHSISESHHLDTDAQKVVDMQFWKFGSEDHNALLFWTASCELMTGFINEMAGERLPFPSTSEEYAKLVAYMTGLMFKVIMAIEDKEFDLSIFENMIMEPKRSNGHKIDKEAFQNIFKKLMFSIILPKMILSGTILWELHEATETEGEYISYKVNPEFKVACEEMRKSTEEMSRKEILRGIWHKRSNN